MEYEIVHFDDIPKDAEEVAPKIVLRRLRRYEYTEPGSDEARGFQDAEEHPFRPQIVSSVDMFETIFEEVENQDTDCPPGSPLYKGDGIMSFTIYDISFDFSSTISETRAVWLYQIKNFVEIIFLNLFQFVSYSKSTDNKFKLSIKKSEGSILIEHPYIIDNDDDHNYLETLKLVNSQFINVKKQSIDWKSKGMVVNSLRKIDTNFFLYFPYLQ